MPVRWRSSRRHGTFVAAGLALGGLLALPGCKPPLTLTVTSTADLGDSNPGDGQCTNIGAPGACSLRAAIDEANASPDTLVTVMMSPGTYAVTAVGDDDTNAAGDLDVASTGAVDIKTTGPGVTIAGGGADRVFDNRGFLGVHGVTVTGGITEGDGGAIRGSGLFTYVDSSTVAGNVAGGRGGAIEVSGGLFQMDRSTVSGNTARTSGGGVHVATGATAKVADSTVSGNTVDPALASPGADAPAAAVVPSGDATPPATAPAVAQSGAGEPDPTTGTSVPVVIELAVDGVVGPPADPEQAARQRAEVARARQPVTDLLNRQGGRVRREYRSLPYVAAEVDPGTLEALQGSPFVRSVQPDRLDAPTLAQSIPWINADDAHAAGSTGSGSVVAVIDTGVDTGHPMLSGKVVAQACFAQGQTFGDTAGDCPDGSTAQIGGSSGTNCAYIALACWHGTHVASTAAGAASGSLVGVASGAQVISVRVFSHFTGAASCGGAAECVLAWGSDQLAALDHIYSIRAGYNLAAVNMSLGGGRYYTPCDTDYRKMAIDNLKAAGIATVISSGNNGYKNSMGAPGCISSAVSVGATGDDNDSVAAFSNSASFLDLLAPGVQITAAYPGGLIATADGTSMAAPHVAGALAVLHSLLPGSSVDADVAALGAGGVAVTDAANGQVTRRIDLTGAIAAGGGPGRGGGVHNQGTLTLRFTTLAANQAPWGGGLVNEGSATVQASVVASQGHGADCATVSGAGVTSTGRNLDSDGSCALAGAGDLPAQVPLLGSLAANGGATATHLPGLGSPLREAIPAGLAGICDAANAKDQRGVTRPTGPGCDIGSVEQ